MGTTFYHATHYKNGKPDFKKECDYLCTDTKTKEPPIKSSVVGNIYYAACKGKDDEIYCMVIRCHSDMKSYFNFGYKEMDETMMPYYFKCPKGILKLLTPTDNEYANEWRKRCYEYHTNNKGIKE